MLSCCLGVQEVLAAAIVARLSSGSADERTGSAHRADSFATPRMRVLLPEALQPPAPPRPRRPQEQSHASIELRQACAALRAADGSEEAARLLILASSPGFSPPPVLLMECVPAAIALCDVRRHVDRCDGRFVSMLLGAHTEGL